jgi:3-methyladenine DNA glycosylase AlkD
MWVDTLTTQLQQAANSQTAQQAQAYMLNQFSFFGIYTPQRRLISALLIKEQGILTYHELKKTVTALYIMPQREYHYIAIELVAFHKKYFEEDIIELLHYLIVTKSWWDTVDNVASLLLTPYFKKYPQQIIPVTNSWNKSQNIWLQRSSIMFQKAF